MPKITTKTPRKDVTIAGLTLSVALPYEAGHALTANEAATLNQTFVENIRNNRADAVKTSTEKKEKLEAIQTALDEYVVGYEFGAVRQGDPVLKEARRRARVAVEGAIKKKGKKVKDFTSEQLNKLASDAIDKHPHFMEEAKAEIERRNAVVEDLDIPI